MGLWIKEPTDTEHVPGTTLLDESKSGLDANISSVLKTAKHDPNLILVPQPSDDPNDPLNWSPMKKGLCFWSLCLGTAIVCAPGPMLASAFLNLVVEFDVSITKITQLSSILVLLGAPALWISAAIIPFYGKRPIFLSTLLLLFASSCWAAKAKTYGSLLGARALMGLATGPLEGVVTGTIGDLFFVHERGFYTAAWVMFQLVPTNLSPVICAFIIRSCGWRWAFWILGIVSMVFFTIIFFLSPETHYVRASSDDIDIEIEKDKPVDSHIEDTTDASAAQPDLEKTRTAQSGPGRQYVVRSYREELMPWRAINDENASFWRALYRPIGLLLYPTMFWCSFGYAMTVNWAIVFNVSLAQILGVAPYNFGTIALGLVYLAAVVFAIIAGVLCGPASDFIAKFLARRNHGVYEPEFRIPVVTGLLFFGTFSLVGFGLSVNAVNNWFGPVFFFGMVNCASLFGNTTFLSYMVDSHRSIGAEGCITVNIFKACFVYGFEWFVNSWISTQGVKNTFGTCAGLNAFICLTGVVMYIYGKRARSWIARTEFLNKLQIE